VPEDPDAPAEFAALSDAYHLLADRARRTDEPAGTPHINPRGPSISAGGVPLWAGPVHIDRPDDAANRTTGSELSAGWPLMDWFDSLWRTAWSRWW
jgi:hypothetical protein